MTEALGRRQISAGHRARPDTQLTHMARMILDRLRGRCLTAQLEGTRFWPRRGPGVRPGGPQEPGATPGVRSASE